MPSGYSEVTLLLSGLSGEIVLQFSDNYPPLFVSVQRWDAEHAGTDSMEVWDSGEQIAVADNAFQIFNNRIDYIYEVNAKWEQGYSWYVFRVDSAITFDDTVTRIRLDEARTIIVDHYPDAVKVSYS
jgi:hypothetical protein